MNRRVKAGAAIAVLALLTACGGTGGSSGNTAPPPQQPAFSAGWIACEDDWNGTVVATHPDDDPGELPDVICETADGQLVQLDGDNAELESDADNYPVYEEGDNGLFFLFLWINGVKTKVGSKSYTLPPNYKRPEPGRYVVPSAAPRTTAPTTGATPGRTGSTPRPGVTTSRSVAPESTSGATQSGGKKCRKVGKRTICS